MERFVSERNVERYRQLASGNLSAGERRTVFTELSEEQARYRDSSALKIPAPEISD